MASTLTVWYGNFKLKMCLSQAVICLKIVCGRDFVQGLLPVLIWHLTRHTIPSGEVRRNERLLCGQEIGKKGREYEWTAKDGRAARIVAKR
jgi:hypothetical protein